jgi:predicted ribosome quality control (RQC) complex YloA/Tae2 family protein
MKQRFSSLDVSSIVSELTTTLPSLRLTQIYDLSTRIFLLKFGKPGHRASLLIDAGFRAHLTQFSRTAAASPSAFVSKLRKCLRSRRVTGVRQLGKDRVVEISFSEGQWRLYLEFFAAGNLVLVDGEGGVVCLWRVVSEGDEEVDVKVGGRYNVEGKQGGVEVTKEVLVDVLRKGLERAKAVEGAGGKGKKRKGAGDLKKVVAAGFPEYSVQLVEHAFLRGDVDGSMKPEEVLADEVALGKVLDAMLIAQDVVRKITQGGEVKGYIIAKSKEGSQQETVIEGAGPSRENLLYEDFHPFRPAQFEDKADTHILEFEGFNKTVDEFYSSLESQKLESRLTEREEKARRKIEEAKLEHQKRVGALQQVQEMHIRKAQAIEANTHRVEEATAAVNGLIGQGMDWMDIAKLIEGEQGRGNAVAEMVKLPLKLYENTVTLLLDEPGADIESEDEDDADITDEDVSDSDDDARNKATTVATKPQSQDKRLAIDIDLALSPWSNARQYYDQKKTAAVKEQKTVAQSSQALQNAQRKIEADLKKGLKEEKAVLRPQRKAFWFEKFSYFISSDGYLVLGGKDAQQNELLYRRYLKKGDIYVHADLQGAASVVVKNLPSMPDAPIPPSTLSQAGALTVSTSSAWDSKAVMAAWWVEAGQVSKTTPTGEYLATGGFMIRGKKNFLPPSQLLLGFGVLFLVSEDSRKNRPGKGRYADAGEVEKSESVAVEQDGRELHGDIQNLSVENREQDDAAADFEDPADEDESEKEDDQDDAISSERESSDDEEASVAGSEVDTRRANPLQVIDAKADLKPDEQQGARDDDDDDKDHDDEITDHEDAAQNEDHESHPEAISTKLSTPAPPSTGRSTPDPQNLKQTRLPRGKRTKLKKAAQKYAHQDDSDRAIAMELLGSSKAEQRKQQEADSKEQREVKNAADRARRKAQHERAAQKEAARQARIEAGEEEVDEQDEETLAQERQELRDLDLLVGVPAAGDEILAAVPMVGPWGACGRLKYKVKMQPGSLKKGKAVKEIVSKWTELAKANARILDPEGRDKERCWPKEIEAIKGWRVEEVVGSVPVGKVRVVWSGGLGGTAGGVGSGGPARGPKAGRGGKGSKKR